MFKWCSNLITLPRLYIISHKYGGCYNMFYNCSKIKISSSMTWDYQTLYRLPPNWTWSAWGDAFTGMFSWTWWTFTWTPSINTTYYTSNIVV